MKEIAENPILNKEQKDLLLHFNHTPLTSIFYLTGGTALSAFYLYHRRSDDLDFFTAEDVEIEPILSFLNSIPGKKGIKYERKYDRRIFLLEYPHGSFLKVEFTRYPFKHIAPLKKYANMWVDSIQDILANKLISMTDRRDPKDFIDTYFILKVYPDLNLEEAINKSEEKFGVKGVSAILSGRFLNPPDLGNIPLVRDVDPSMVTNFFREAARTLIRHSILPDE